MSSCSQRCPSSDVSRGCQLSPGMSPALTEGLTLASADQTTQLHLPIRMGLHRGFLDQDLDTPQVNCPDEANAEYIDTGRCFLCPQRTPGNHTEMSTATTTRSGPPRCPLSGSSSQSCQNCTSLLSSGMKLCLWHMPQLEELHL